MTFDVYCLRTYDVANADIFESLQVKMLKSFYKIYPE